jgi:Ca-activated chloride channel family protein
MNAQSFEYQLRQATAPAPDAAAQLRAKSAALAEFQRLHTAANQPMPPESSWLSGLRRVFHTRGSRNRVIGGFATACVIFIAVSTFFLVPRAQRQVLVQPSQPPVTPREESQPQAINIPPPPLEEQYVAPTRPAHTPKSKPTQPKIPAPEPSQLEQISPPVVDEVTVTGQRPEASAISATPGIAVPEPVTAPRSDGSLNEIIVTGAKANHSWLGRIFSRNEPQTIPGSFSPITAGRDKFEHFEVNPVKQVSAEPVSTFSAEVDTASYSFVRRELNQGRLPQVDAVRVEEMINYFDYNWPASDSREQPFKPTVTVSDSPWGEGKKLIHIGIKGYELPVKKRPDVNLVLLLDVSGSMDQPDKLPLAQKSMALLLDTLKPTDTVAIVVYAGAAGEVLPPTPIKQKETILEALNSLRPGGSTAGAEGIRLAYALAERNFREGGVNRILLATDGDFNVGITNTNELKGFVEREREKGVFLSFLGFGEGNYRDDMGQILAQNGNGVAAYIDTLNEAKKVLVQESTASLFTIAKDVKFQVEFNPATVAEYRLIGYENRALKREDFNNDKVDAGDVGSGHAVTAIYEITPVGSKEKSIDELRYGEEAPTTRPEGKANEYGFLRIRYKLPNGFRSRLIEQPILINSGVPEALQDTVRFSTAVAGFGQLLRGGKYTGPLTYDEVIKEAKGSLGDDPYGYRAEFLALVHKAKGAP